ncbi:hypothetical protein [Pseudactinotalea sp. HY158]|uniref:hypothetical protein n=1 Tax=Pseudactinotalea sp. HY158 TaxID=2654547 RepID=UPI00129C7E4C|nr:hypothetical protein [Pseudactinotalea sp. HY158]QGH70224.1 hypothetical protein GCE65_12470 [Pseudactinotalea sp. HY158]
MVANGINDMEHAHRLVTRAEAIRAGERETRPLDELMSAMEISREELDAAPDRARMWSVRVAD